MELTANFTYIRFHGSGTRYGGNYPNEVLRKWAWRIRQWEGILSDVFVYFNNDAEGYRDCQRTYAAGDVAGEIQSCLASPGSCCVKPELSYIDTFARKRQKTLPHSLFSPTANRVMKYSVGLIASRVRTAICFPQMLVI